jgi:hypothetical protein
VPLRNARYDGAIDLLEKWDDRDRGGTNDYRVVRRGAALTSLGPAVVRVVGAITRSLRL